MAEFPALPLWTDRYLADTRHLSRDEHGAYLLLLMEAWRRPGCSLPDNDALLARLSNSTEAEWTILKPVIMAFWKLDNRAKEWTQKTLSKERDYVARNSLSQRDKAVKRWKHAKKDDAAAMPKGMPDRYRNDAPTPTPTPTPNKIDTTSSLRSDVPRQPKKRATRLTEDWVLPKAWGDWALEQGMSRERIMIEAQQMRDWSISTQKATKLDWQATWKGWVRRAMERPAERKRELRGSEFFTAAAELIGERARDRESHLGDRDDVGGVPRLSIVDFKGNR